MFELATSIVIFASMLIGAGILVFRAYRDKNPLVYRKVIEREVDGTSELVTLTCGHKLRIRHRQRTELPCEECRETLRILKEEE